MGDWGAVGAVVTGAIGATEIGDEGVEDEVDSEGFVEKEGLSGGLVCSKSVSLIDDFELK